MEGFKLLIWKNYKILSRDKVSLAASILVPLLCVSALVAMRCSIKATTYSEPIIYEAFSPWEIPEIVRNRTHTLYYAPSNPLTDSIMQKVLDDCFSSRGLDYNFIAFSRVSEMVHVYRDGIRKGWADSREVLAAVVFRNVGQKTLPQEIKYTLRFPGSQRTKYNLLLDQLNTKSSWLTGFPWPYTSFGGPRSRESKYGGFPGYFDEGFLYLQNGINEAIVKSLLNSTELKDLEKYDLRLRRFPAPPFTHDTFPYVLQFLGPYVLLLAFVYNLLELTKQIIHEKSARLKEFMKIMGLSSWQHSLAWFVRSYLLLVVVAVVMVLMLKLEFKNSLSILTRSNPWAIFLCLAVYILNVITFAFMFSALFSNGFIDYWSSVIQLLLEKNVGSIMVAFTWIFSGYHNFALLYHYFKLTFWVKFMSCLFSPNTPLFFIINIIRSLESFGEGLQWSNFWHGLNPEDNFSVGMCLLISLLNSMSYFVISLYVELAFPGEYGLALPWYFPFTIWFWTGGTPNSSLPTFDGLQSEAYEAEPSHLEAGVVINDLTKVFGSKAAVKRLNLKMYRNQVTSFLGPNGAGKSTTLSVLTGLIRSTSGTVKVNSYDVQTEINKVRRSLGFCPQYNILFDNLTVEEHLQFYCQLKGLNKTETRRETDRCLKALGLEDKRKTESKRLSGGMKRKLCVAMAFSAGSKVVILDEPTAGIDPEARRSTWDLIQAEKRGRTVILSTHYMEEADLLGDRIAIIKDGHLRCYGSSLFLKTKFGGGYNLVLVKTERTSSQEIRVAILEIIPSVLFKTDTTTEIRCTLPIGETSLFPILFDKLEARKEELGIRTFGVGSTTLEEIFFRVTDPSGNTARNGDFHLPGIPDSVGTPQSQIQNGSESPLGKELNCKRRNEGMKLFTQQFIGMFKKKFLLTVRSRSLLFIQVLVPFVGLFVCYRTIKYAPGLETPKEEFNTFERIREHLGSNGKVGCFHDPRVCQAYKRVAQMDLNFEDVENMDFVTNLLKSVGSVDRQDESKYILALEEDFNLTTNRNQLTFFFNNQAFHSPPVSLNWMWNGILELYGRGNRISTSNHPFDHKSTDGFESSGALNENYSLGLSVNTTMLFVVGTFLFVPLSEKTSKWKNLQILAGAKLGLYWSVIFLADMIIAPLIFLAIVLVTIIFGMDSFSSWEARMAIWSSVLVFVIASIPLCMVLSTLMDDPTTAYARILIIGFMCVFEFAAFGLFRHPEIGAQKLVNTVHDILSYFPSYGLGMAITQIGKTYLLKTSCVNFNVTQDCGSSRDGCCFLSGQGYYAWEDPGIGKYLVRMGGLSIGLLVMLIAIESGFLSKIARRFRWENPPSKLGSSTVGMLDVDVAVESNRINRLSLARLGRMDGLIIKNLRKIYGGKFVAVDGLTFGVRPGEVFGLLGVNGAGKTSSFKMLTGNTSISSGDAFINNHSVTFDLKRAQSFLGYCPQFDACMDDLTGRETMKYFAQLKGIPEDVIPELIVRIADRLLFRSFLDKPFGSLSGGNKRKVSVAIGMLGEPDVILLDEPTAGMDPISTRHVWNAIGMVRDAGASILLASHNMEECEMLCSKLAIMGKGQLKCIGSPQYLKSKLLPSYKLVVQLGCSSEIQGSGDWEQLIQHFEAFMENQIPGCVLKDSHSGFLEYLLPTNRTTWAKIFYTMEEAKKEFILEGYNIGQADLEQVFFQFAEDS